LASNLIRNILILLVTFRAKVALETSFIIEMLKESKIKMNPVTTQAVSFIFRNIFQNDKAYGTIFPSA